MTTTSPSLPPPARPGLRWSASGLSTYTECGERWRRKYIEQEWSLPSARMMRGTVVHEQARVAYERRLAGRALPTVEETRDLTASRFERVWDSGVRLAPDEETEGLSKVQARSKDFAIALSVHHVQRVAPAIRPALVEHRILKPIPNSGLELHGILDLVATRPEDIGGEIVRDLKTSERSPNADAAERSLQMTTYAALREQETGAIPPLALDHLVRTPAAKMVSHVVQVTTRTQEDITQLHERVRRAAAGVAAGIFLPASADSWRCAIAWCEFAQDGSCPFFRRGANRPTT